MNEDSGDPLLARNWPASMVEQCLANRDTAGLVQFLRERHRQRFFKPINQLKSAKGNSQGFGFAVMALCSLLIETVQSYRDGLPTTHQGELSNLRKLDNVPSAYQLPPDLKVKGDDEFKKFFVAFQSDFPGIDGEEFYKNIRNGLLHQGQTKGGWLLHKGGSVVRHAKKKIIYRDQFSERLEGCFKKYLGELETHSWEHEIWANAARKIWWLVRLSR